MPNHVSVSFNNTVWNWRNMPPKLNTRIKKELKETLKEQKQYHSEMFKANIKQAFLNKYNNKAKASLFEEFANEVNLDKYEQQV